MIKENLIILLILLTTSSSGQVNLVKNKHVSVSSEKSSNSGSAQNLVDGFISDQSVWISKDASKSTLTFGLEKESRLGGVHIYLRMPKSKPAEELFVEFKKNNAWHVIPSTNVNDNKFNVLALAFDATVEVFTDSIRIVFNKTRNENFVVSEVCVWPENKLGLPHFGTDVSGYVGQKEPFVPKIFINQSGYNFNKPKRFTAPLSDNGTVFNIVEKGTEKALFSGKIGNKVGDFSAFNPVCDKEYVIIADTFRSFLFCIGMWWAERVTYQQAINFIIDSRHYVGNYTQKCRGSYSWRDDAHFGWELHSLVPQYLSNPTAYERMPQQIKYQIPTDTTLWGTLKPYDESAPDIVKMIHWGADVIISQKLTHEHFKGQLAYFLYAWPYIKQWMPQQNYDVVKNFALKIWQLDTVDQIYPYDESIGHNMLALKTKVGTTKGALPPGASIIPNLMMYEMAKCNNLKDAGVYFDAAYKQVEWMVQKLDWNDPLTTKGQRVSEFITMTSLAYMLRQYPDRAPAGLKAKIEAWADVVIRRSQNMWDFRKLDDTDQWCPTGNSPQHWNEVGNLVGFPAAVLSMIEFIDNKHKAERLTQIAYAQLDNSFGRNPCGRHCSYDAVAEVEGVDLGWYHQHPGGIGQLKDARFVLEGSPKNAHYPYHPERGDIGWTEGWVTFNVAYNLSLSYMAYNDTEWSVSRNNNKMTLRLKVPLNFDYNSKESVWVNLKNKKGKTTKLKLTEETESSEWFTATLKYPGKKSTVSYGLGYFEKSISF